MGNFNISMSIVVPPPFVPSGEGIKERFQNPVVGDIVNLKLFAYNSNNRTDFNNIHQVEIYYLDPQEVTETVPDGRRLVETVTNADIAHMDTGLYGVSIFLNPTQYVIGNYVDVWYVSVDSEDVPETIENKFEIYPNLIYTSPNPICYDFNFVFRPNKIRYGSKRYIVIEITPNVPSTTDMERYYRNLAIASPMKITIKKACGDCMPDEEDLRIVVEDADVELRDRTTGYYFLDTEELSVGIFDVSFKMEFGESTYISDIQQLQIY